MKIHFRDSTYILFVNVLLSKLSYITKSKFKGWRDGFLILMESNYERSREELVITVWIILSPPSGQNYLSFYQIQETPSSKNPQSFTQLQYWDWNSLMSNFHYILISNLKFLRLFLGEPPLDQNLWTKKQGLISPVLLMFAYYSHMLQWITRAAGDYLLLTGLTYMSASETAATGLYGSSPTWLLATFHGYDPFKCL